MVRAKRKSSGSAPDFAKAKQKVGGRKVAPANETRTEFRSRKITVPAQLQRHPDPDTLPLAGLNIANLLSKTRHHNVRERRQALEHLDRALQRDSKGRLPASHLTNIVRVASRLVLDDDRGVRRALQALLRQTDFDRVAKFAADQLHRFVLAAMTHPSVAVRLDGIAALDAILEVAIGTTTVIRQQYLSALIAALAERTETDALALGKGSVSLALRCCIALLGSGADDPRPDHADRISGCWQLALLHTPDPFRSPPIPKASLSAELLHRLASSLTECAIEAAGHNSASLSACLKGLVACARTPLPAATRDRLRQHIMPMFAAPFAHTDQKLLICRLTVLVDGSLSTTMMAFVARCCGEAEHAALACEVLVLYGHLPQSLAAAFAHGLGQMTPSALILDVCRKFSRQWSADDRDPIVGSIMRRFLSHPSLCSGAIEFVLESVRAFTTRMDLSSLLDGNLLSSLMVADQLRIVALIGYVDLGLEDLPQMVTILCDGAVSVSARSLLLDLVLQQPFPITSHLSLLMTIAARSNDDDLLPSVMSSLSSLSQQRPESLSAISHAIERSMPAVEQDHQAIRRLQTLSSVCFQRIYHSEQTVPLSVSCM